MGATTTMILYYLLAILLAGGGVLSILKGQALFRSGNERGVVLRSLTLSARSAGLLLMCAGPLWALAATLVLPDYLDAEVEFKRLEAALEEREKTNAILERELDLRQALLNGARRDEEQADAKKAAMRQAVDDRLQEQMARISELRMALRNNSTAAALRAATQLEQLSLAIREATQER